jgi:hypothetical protein
MKCLWILPVFLLCSCSTAFLTIKTSPEGANVYVVPKTTWISDSIKYSDPSFITDYLAKDGQTPIHIMELSQREYAVILVKDDKRKVVHVDLKNDINEDKARTIDVDLN